MADILTQIEAYKRKEIEAAKRVRPLGAIEAEARTVSAPRGLRSALARARLLGRRRGLSVGIDGCPLVSGPAGFPRCRARRDIAAGLAQGFHVRPLSGGRGTRL